MGDEFEIPVEILDVRKIKKIKTIENYPLNPIYALALSPIVSHIHQLKLQFSLKHFFGRFQLHKYVLKSGTLAALIIGIFGVSFIMGNQWINEKKNDFLTQSRAAETKTLTLRKEAANLYVEYAEYDQIRQQFLAQATYVQELNRVSWAQVFAVVANELPLDLALTSFKFSENGSAKIKGDALNMESISEMLRRIEESAILDKGKFDFLKEKCHAVLKHQVPTDDPRGEAAERGIGVGIGAARKRDHRRKLGVAKPREHATDASDNKRDHDGRARILRGRRTRDDEYAGTDDRADADGNQMPRPKHALKLSTFTRDRVYCGFLLCGHIALSSSSMC